MKWLITLFIGFMALVVGAVAFTRITNRRIIPWLKG